MKRSGLREYRIRLKSVGLGRIGLGMFGVVATVTGGFATFIPGAATGAAVVWAVIGAASLYLAVSGQHLTALEFSKLKLTMGQTAAKELETVADSDADPSERIRAAGALEALSPALSPVEQRIVSSAIRDAETELQYRNLVIDELKSMFPEGTVVEPRLNPERGVSLRFDALVRGTSGGAVYIEIRDLSTKRVRQPEVAALLDRFIAAGAGVNVGLLIVSDARSLEGIGRLDQAKVDELAFRVVEWKTPVDNEDLKEAVEQGLRSVNGGF
ncbi:hypothetical protein [Kribbella jiaozuonensis]|uniref:Uncharacterized protein n=1 Tax=Kribbella jiaozuonensis TaxID=2575441 RepID=A0A4U3M3W6_9ACTN|nr:hypothetical protein [Kribbella jiaozuonensis]TKK82819.1 hypothetical protein FDA38_08685 [Kribbella jiaozuonensis]